MSTKAEATENPELECWRPYDLDHYAQDLVIRNRTKKEVLNESHKMRMTVAYGLERFWGEQFRLERDNFAKAQYWKDVWRTLAEDILKPAGIGLPNKNIKSNRTDKNRKEAEEAQNIREMAKLIWDMPQHDREIALMVLTQLCDSLVWWTQRYKKKEGNQQSQ